jgi:amino acid adenylation domain-containing protein
MNTESTSQERANRLIRWIREYAPLRINSYLIDTQGSIPSHIYLDLGNQGFFGMHVSRKYGGLELKTSDMLRVIEQIAAIDLTLCVIVIECIQGAHTLEKYASKSMKQSYLPLLAKGRVFTAGAMTESAAGSNPRAMKSVATPDNGHGWLLNGSKRWVGMGASADLIAIYVQQLDSNNQWIGMSGFLVQQGVKGLEIGSEAPTMGLRGFPKNTIHMDNIKVSSEHLLGKIGEGMEIAQDNMMYIRLCLAAASIGAMKNCTQLMHRYAERRTIATGQLAENPVTQVRISEMIAIIDALDAFIYVVTEFFDKDEKVVPEEMLVAAKILGTEHLGWIVDVFVQMLGARGYEEASGVSKIFRDARAFRIFEGPTEALNMYIGSRVLVKNTRLEFFVRKQLQQSKLFDEIILAVNEINMYVQANHQGSFSKPFSVNYWSQSLAGEVITYGLLLCGIEYSIKTKPSDHLHRAHLWARNKYNSIVQHSLMRSIDKKILIQSSQIQKSIYRFTELVGNIEPSRKTQDICIDSLLKNNQEKNIHDSNYYIEHKASHEVLENDYSPVATEKEKQLLLHEWNNIENGIKRPNICIYDMFEEQVNKNKDAVAVIYKDESLTYEELNIRANILAHFLRKKGVTKNTLVAIFMERSLDMIVGLLGILKAGGAYLPLDHHYPIEALKFMLNDSGAKIILSHRKLEKTIPVKLEQVIFYDDVDFDCNEKLLSGNKNMNDLCYVIYTSGSTGQPKGVMLPHKALTNLILWHQEKIPEKRNVLQFTSLNFDMSFLEIFSALTAGGTLILISEQDRMNLNKLSKIIKTKNVQTLMIPISFLKHICASNINKNDFGGVKEIIVAGEQITVTHEILQFFEHYCSCRLFNYYGPSETHVVAAYDFPRTTDNWQDHPPIGRAISNTKILILNDEMQVVPIGTPGEIYIGGSSLAKGYINRPDLTNERFIDDPWDDSREAKLYKTGDYGQYLSDGNILFIGRKDSQVKIRGFRIELQEIESNLIKFPGIQEAIVIVKKDVNKEKYLEAFIVKNIEQDNLIEHIIKFLKDRMPSHMIPACFHVLGEMPLTLSGKINRSALESYEPMKHSQQFGKKTPPATKTEKKLVKILENFFKIHIGTNYSLASIGGNSLLAMQIVSQIHNQFAVELPAYSLLSDVSLSETARRIDKLLSEKLSLVHTMSQ